MKRSLLSHLIIALSVGLCAIGQADAATMVPITACTDCHGTNPQTNQAPIEGPQRNNPARAIVGSHSFHVNAATCSGCHIVPAALDHEDGQINLTPSISGGSYSKTSTFPVSNTNNPGTCSGTSCHADAYSAGSIVSPSWGVTSGCAACHSGAGVIGATGPVTGSHTKHSTAVCTDCHNAGTTATVAPTTGHADGNIDVIAGYPANRTKHAAGSGYFTCATASCHASAYGTAPAVTPTWGVVAGCAACHSGAGTIAASGPVTGSHTQHNDPTCTNCHNAGTTATVAPSSGHIDGNIDVTVGYTANVTKHAAGTYTGTCTTSLCHGTSSPVWGANTTSAGCVKCHGVSGTTPAQYTANNNTAAPGYNGGRDTGGATVATDLQVGAHSVHLTGASNYMNTIACTECHANVNPTNAAFTGHMNGAGNVDFGTIAKSNATVPTYTAPNCATTYCHFGNPTGSYAPAAAVSWTNTALLTGTPSLAGDCSKCHLSPPSTTGSHTGGMVIADCNGCHDHVTTLGAFSDKSKHINGIVDATGCSGCHGWPPTTGAHTVHIDNIITERGLGSLPGGFVGNQVCGTCHNVSSLTKHAGTVGNDGTSRNIYLPTPSTMQAAYQFGVNPVSYDKGATTTCSNISCHLGTSTAWGTPPTSTCQSCHGYPPVTTLADIDNKHATGATAVNHIGTGPTVNTKSTFVSAHSGCQICHGTQDSGTGTHAPHANYNVAVQHFTGQLNMNGPVGTGTGYNSSIRGCTAACHASTAPYRMTTSNKTLTFGNYGTGGTCVSCHAIAQGTRSAATNEFGLAWGHKKSGRGAVAVADCIVCHLEGAYATQAISATYHQNGNVDLRDPDGAGETPITNNAGAAFTFTKYAISYAAGSRTTTLGNTIAEVVTVKFCMKCHDSNGATNPTARSNNGGTGTATMPFGGINLGTNYTTANGAAVAGGLVNVASQFAAANSSRHPVGAANSRAYPYSTKLAAPYNGIGTTRNSNTLAGNTASPRVKANSVILVCEDCHTTGTTLLTRTITAHGNAAGLRGTYYATGPTLCTACHTGTYNDTTNGRHNTGSAFSVGTTRAASALNNCEACHFSKISAATAIRPIKASDIHGFNTMLGTAAGWTYGAANGMRPIAFLRNNASFTSTSPRPYTATVAGPGQFNLAAGQSTCGGSGTIVFCNGNDSHTNYSPGGSY